MNTDIEMFLSKSIIDFIFKKLKGLSPNLQSYCPL